VLAGCAGWQETVQDSCGYRNFYMKPQTSHLGRRALLSAVTLSALLGLATSVAAQKVFFEDFEGLTLGPNREEGLLGANVWTKAPPAGWTLDDSRMPGVGNPALDGVTEWAGWSFANKDWWNSTAGDQRRSDFTFGSGTVLIADNDEWDDAAHAKGFWDASISTVDIDISGAAPDSLILAFDSSWRPEALDDPGASFPTAEDGSAINDQTGLVFFTFDGGSTNQVVRWESTRTLADGSDNPFFKEDKTKQDPTNPDEVSNTNEPYFVAVGNKAGQKKLKVTFSSIEAANDWWWALDNIAVGVPPLVTGVNGTGVGFKTRIIEALGKNVDENQPITVKVDGVTKSPVQVTRGEGGLVFVGYDQTPAVYQPKSKHTVDVTFKTTDGRTVTDAASFVAPSYTTVTATPAVVTATVRNPAYFAVDTTKPVTVKLDGVTVNPTSVTPVADPASVVVRVGLSTVLPPGSSHKLAVTFTTDGGAVVTDEVTFAAAAFKTISAELATAVGTGAQPGMLWRTHQLEAGRANSTALVEEQLLGILGASIHDTTGQNAQGLFEIDYVNFEQSGAAAGVFREDGLDEFAVADGFIPGIPGTTGGTDNIGAAALTYVEIPAAGIYTMVVRSDDGFQVSVGNATNPTFQILGGFDGGRGDAPTEFYFEAPKAGVYLFRLLFYEGGGGASVEWYTVNAAGKAALVGGSQPGALKAFRVRTVAEPVILTTPANITVQPKPVEVTEGNTAALLVTAAGDAPLSYQWSKVNGTTLIPVAGATTASLLLSKATPAVAGNYVVRVSNNSGSVTSNPVAVSVLLRQRSKVLLSEDFEGLTLGANIEEGIVTGNTTPPVGGPQTAVWTETPPSGWVIDDTGVPGLGNSTTDGVVEWAGWSFAKREWWAATAGDQTRTRFLKGTGAIAVVDGDEWDDQPRTAGSMTSLLTTRAINVAGLEANSIVLKFDSSWRPEAPQKAVIRASFDGGAPIEILRWTADAGPTFHADNQNETVTIQVPNPANAQSLKLTFGYLDAGNNWWWAFDNLVVSGDPVGFNSLASGIATYLPFEDSYNDASGMGINGTAKGTPSFVAGKVGKAVNVRTVVGGEFSYVSLGRQILFGTNVNFTVAFWAKVNSLSGDPSFLANKNWGGGGNVGFVLASDNDRRIQWNLNTVGGARADFDSAGGFFTDATWKHVVVSFDRNGPAETWIDGVKVNSKSIAANAGQSLDTPTLDLNIGQDGTGTYTDGGGVFHNFDMDEFALWTRILSDSEIASAYNKGVAGQALVVATVPSVTASGVPPAGFSGATLTNIVVDSAKRTITADLPANGDQGYLTIDPIQVIKTVKVEGGKLVVTY
jgi:hypothetical protein